MSNEKLLEISSSKIDMHYNELDSNAINFFHENGYLSIQIQSYIDEDNEDIENETYFEFNNESTGQYIAIKKLSIKSDQISIELSEVFCLHYSKINIKLPNGINEKMVDFFANYLFLGDVISYDKNIPENLRIKQTQFREYL